MSKLQLFHHRTFLLLRKGNNVSPFSFLCNIILLSWLFRDIKFQFSQVHTCLGFFAWTLILYYTSRITKKTLQDLTYLATMSFTFMYSIQRKNTSDIVIAFECCMTYCQKYIRLLIWGPIILPYYSHRNSSKYIWSCTLSVIIPN